MLQSIVAPHQLALMAELAAKTPYGCFCEVGVYQGGGAWRLYEVAVSQNRHLHLFDTFSGTPHHIPGLDKHETGNAEFIPPPGTVQNIKNTMPLAIIHRGIYPQTHPPSLGNIAFIHCDCDQYQSYRDVIDRMWPLVVPKGCMLFDDYPYLAGAKKAVEETFGQEQLHRLGERFYVVKEDKVLG